ncbi:AP2/ERF and B3 domain-containing transcription factor At1g50680-like [Apium graveolens]|uniref:AP2/ERF and B3 domain-containing transcription factor At1g50680-like n=1 Tax=Apium graveolens TaxID=4045 RepID=UPI003D7B159E
MKGFLNVTAHMVGKASGSNSTRQNQSCNKRARHLDGNCSSSSQGVVALPNGKWAAYVYVNNDWILLGIFGSEKEAVIAYENTTLNIWMEGCKRYLQGINNGEHDPLTLQQASTDSIHSSSSVNVPQVNGEQECIRTKLFGKVLTRTDVGRADKLVIPRIFAGCFPSIPDEDESSLEERPINDVELGFYDQSMKLWKFRYCYWRKNKSYSLSKGWRKFVQEKDLSSGDEVIFFKCERVEDTSVVDTYFMIDVQNANEVQVEEVGGKMGDTVVSSHSEGVQDLQNEENAGGIADVRHFAKIQADKDLEAAGAGSGKAPVKEVMLFGVKIIA